MQQRKSEPIIAAAEPFFPPSISEQPAFLRMWQILLAPPKARATDAPTHDDQTGSFRYLYLATANNSIQQAGHEQMPLGTRSDHGHATGSGVHPL